METCNPPESNEDAQCTLRRRSEYITEKQSRYSHTRRVNLGLSQTTVRIPSAQHKESGPTHLGCSAEVGDVCKQVESGAYTQSEGSCDFESPHRISDIVEHIVDV